MSSATPQTDAVALLAGLSVKELRQRINDLEAEVKAVRVLLRAAVARERLLERRAPRREEAAHV